MIEIIDLHKNFDNTPVLDGVNLKIHKGESFALIGGSGKGKSVLLKNVIGLQTPDQGQVLIDNSDVHKLRGRKLKSLKDRIGIVFQFGALFDSLSVYENVAFPLEEKTKLSDSEIKKRVLESLAKVGLEGEEHKFPAQISGGMRKRVAIARCLIMKPEIIFFDEPTTGLDPIITQSIYQMIQKLNKEHNLTALIISHEIPRIFDIVDRAAMLHNGKIIACGTTDEIQSSNNASVQKFLKGEID